MVKKIGVIALLLLFSITLISADPEVLGENEAEEIQEAIDNFVPIDNDGELNKTKFRPIVSNAEEKIDEINIWLEENATWLKAVFGMVPAITFLFFINIYFILFFITHLILNADETLGLIPGLQNKIKETSISWAKLLGIVIFALLLTTRIILKIAVAIGDQIVTHWHKTWEVVTPIAVIVMILIIVGLIALYIYAPQVFKAISKVREAKRNSKNNKEAFKYKEAMKTIVKAATEGQ